MQDKENLFAWANKKCQRAWHGFATMCDNFVDYKRAYALKLQKRRISGACQNTVLRINLHFCNARQPCAFFVEHAQMPHLTRPSAAIV